MLSNCEGEVFDQVVYYPRFNSTLYNSTYRTMQELKIAHKPLIVIMLSIDSFSRKHFFRKLPLTSQFINELNNGTVYRAHEFLIHSIIGSNSVGNIGPILESNF